MLGLTLLSCLALGPDTTEASQAAPAVELRGLWITRWGYKTEADVRRTLAAAAEANFNAVFLQVRGTFDALYPSELEPWSALLTGELGQDPGWDPLAVAVDAARQHGLQVHAYLNTCPLWRGPEPPSASEPTHAYSAHPDWVLADSDGVPMALNDGYVFADPAHPEVRARVAAVAADIAGRYDIDGIHLDYIRYPSSGVWRAPADMPGVSDEPAYRHRLQRGWVTETVAGVGRAVDVPVTAAVWGIHTNDFGWKGVSQGSPGLYQDSVAFLTQGHADANIPMIYWPATEAEGDRLDFRTLARWHVAHKANRHLYTGITVEPDKMSPDQVIEAIAISREVGADGFVLFESTLSEPLLARLKAERMATPAVPPEMHWRR